MQLAVTVPDRYSHVFTKDVEGRRTSAPNSSLDLDQQMNKVIPALDKSSSHLAAISEFLELADQGK